MEFRILGRLEALDGGRDVAPRRAKTRALLALLLLHANERLATDRIIEALWGEEPPTTADKALQGHVSTLRKLLAPSRIQTEHAAYRLIVRPGELDLDRFSSALAAARASRDLPERARRLAGALAMWRDEPLADVTAERFAGPEIARLQALRLAAFEERAEAELELGHHAELIPDLELLVGQHPLSEGLRASLMLALYRSGRQSAALRAYHEGRRLLADELGIEPGSVLQLLERQILAHDPALAVPAPGASTPSRRRQERKTVTLLVVEAVAASPTDPEDHERVVGPMIDRIRSIVERHGGTAEPLFVNAVLGIFGAPRAHDDDPVRAVRAALELREPNGVPALRVRGGIETGEALVTIDRNHVAITGHVLVAASHLQAAAPPDSILVGTATHRATDGKIDYQAVASGAWAPRAVRTARPAARREAPFIGRADELALLERIYARARDERSVQLVTITAEPGGGKSRLVRELRDLLEASAAPPTWRQGSCLPYGDGVTYWGLGEVVKAQARILESDDSQTSAGKLAAAVAALEPDEARRTWLERSLRALVGVEGATATGDREQGFAVWRQFLEAIAAQGPLVLVFEDIHWADEALLAFIDHLVTHASGLPMFVLCTARLELLEGHPGWAGGKRNATTIGLEPLSPAATEELLQSLLGRAPGPLTVRRAGGNPLFAIELAHVVGRVDSEESISIPESLQAVIAARLDTLVPELKALATEAAVIGEVFWSGALASMTGLDESEVERRLARLVASDVARRLRSSSVSRQGEYAFRHVLVRDVAYAQIPRRDRIAKHRSAAAWIERLSGDRLTNHAELVAHHYVRSLELARTLGDAQATQDLEVRARTFLTLAGERARTLDMDRAEALYQRALELTPTDDPARGRLISRLAEIAQLTGRLLEAERLAGEAIDVLRAHGDLLGAGEAMITLVNTLWRLGRSEPERHHIAEAAIRALEQLQPGRELVRAYSRMATHELYAGRAAACRDWSMKALALADSLGAADLTCEPLAFLGIARFELGDLAGMADIRRAVEVGLETGLSWEPATAQTDLGATVWFAEGPSAGFALKERAAGFALDRGLGLLEKEFRAEALWLLVDAGAWQEAYDGAAELLEWDRERGSSRVTLIVQAVQAKVLVSRGRTREAFGLAEGYLARARELGDAQDLVPALTVAAAVRHASGDTSGAIALVDEVERRTRDRDPARRVHELPLAARICVAGGALEIVEALLPTDGGPAFARGRHCVLSGRATLQEARGETGSALEQYEAAAEGWRTFGCPAEEAYALIGRGRCLLTLGRSTEAVESIRHARGIARKLRARPLVEAADRVIAGAG